MAWDLDADRHRNNLIYFASEGSRFGADPHFSLGTRDPAEAKRLHAMKLAEVEERWSNLRSSQRPLSPDEIAREAAAIGDQVRRQLEADPYQRLRSDIEIGATLWGVATPMAATRTSLSG